MPCPPATTTVQSSTLQAEVEKRAQRMALLQAKLQRTRFTLTELQASQQRLRTSTDKVESLNAQLNKDERSKVWVLRPWEGGRGLAGCLYEFGRALCRTVQQWVLRGILICLSVGDGIRLVAIAAILRCTSGAIAAARH